MSLASMHVCSKAVPLPATTALQLQLLHSNMPRSPLPAFLEAAGIQEHSHCEELIREACSLRGITSESIGCMIERGCQKDLRPGDACGMEGAASCHMGTACCLDIFSHPRLHSHTHTPTFWVSLLFTCCIFGLYRHMRAVRA